MVDRVALLSEAQRMVDNLRDTTPEEAAVKDACSEIISGPTSDANAPDTLVELLPPEKLLNPVTVANTRIWTTLRAILDYYEIEVPRRRGRQVAQMVMPALYDGDECADMLQEAIDRYQTCKSINRGSPSNTSDQSIA